MLTQELLIEFPLFLKRNNAKIKNNLKKILTYNG